MKKTQVRKQLKAKKRRKDFLKKKNFIHNEVKMKLHRIPGIIEKGLSEGTFKGLSMKFKKPTK